MMIHTEMSGTVLCDGGKRAFSSASLLNQMLLVGRYQDIGNLQIEPCWMGCSGPNEYIDIVAASEFLVTDAPS